jgi:hypothetical protein
LRIVAVLLCFLLCRFVQAQTLGGSTAYNFLKLSPSAVQSATGGINVSYASGEAGMALNNPALLRSSLHSQLHLNFLSLPGGIQTYTAGGVYHHDKWQTTFGSQLFFVNYGNIPQTDAAGNVSGQFRPVDFCFQLSASKKYLNKWSAGASLKFIQSSYQQFSSQALAADVGLHYFDSAHHFSAGLVAKNMGFPIKSYAGEGEELPFDLQVGISKRLAKAPFGFSITLQNVHRFNTLYRDTLFNNANEIKTGDNFFNKLFGHFVFATHVYLGNHLEASIGYNVLQRQELSTPAGGNGLTGFSTGLRAKFQKLEVQYARTQYQSGISLNQLGIVLKLNRFFSGL